MQEESKSFKEQRIRKITQLYYSRPNVQKAIFEFSKNREVCPRYFEGFGKRPDAFQYTADMFELVKRGATSFHCSEELWSDPLQLETGMPEDKLNNLRIGWDLLIDIDCKYFDFAKITAQAIIKTLKQNGVKNIGLKFSGSKGFHLIIPWKSFPKEIAGQKTKDLFPELPRNIMEYLKSQT
jgi:DNA primase catalytic subunit